MNIKEPKILSIFAAFIYVFAGLASIELLINHSFLGFILAISAIIGVFAALKGSYFLEYLASLFSMCGFSLLIVLQLGSLQTPYTHVLILVSYIILLISRNIAIYPHIYPESKEVTQYRSLLDEAYLTHQDEEYHQPSQE